MSIERTDGSWESNGLHLHYAAWGDEAAPVLIVHHGFLDHGGSWDAVAKRLAETMRVLCVDARGHGDSEWIGAGGAYTFSDYILDLHNLHESLGSPPLRLMGHSMGGSVMSYFAGTFPEAVEGLVLVEGTGPPQAAWKTVPRHMKQFCLSTNERSRNRQPRPMATVADAAEKLRRADPLLGQAQSLELATKATSRVHGGVVWKYDPMHRARIGQPFVLEFAKALWRNISCPVLQVQGGRSPFKWPDHNERLAAFEDIREVVIDDAGHNVHAHAPDALAELALRFFDGLG